MADARPSSPVLPLLAAALLLPLLPACANVRTLISGTSSGAKLDRPAERPHKPLDKRVRHVVIAVAADGNGQIVDTRVVQSSGSPAVDDYVRAYPPPQATPASVTTLELTYSAAEGFSPPKVLKVEPLAAQ